MARFERVLGKGLFAAAVVLLVAIFLPAHRAIDVDFGLALCFAPDCNGITPSPGAAKTCTTFDHAGMWALVPILLFLAVQGWCAFAPRTRRRWIPAIPAFFLAFAASGPALAANFLPHLFGRSEDLPASFVVLAIGILLGPFAITQLVISAIASGRKRDEAMARPAEPPVPDPR